MSAARGDRGHAELAAESETDKGHPDALPGGLLQSVKAPYRPPYLDILAASIVVATVRNGAFYAPDDLIIPGVAMCIAFLAVAQSRATFGRRDAVITVATVVFAIYWWALSLQRGNWSLAHQVVGSALGFLACFAVGRTLDSRSREALRAGTIMFGTLTSAIGLLGLALRITPLALPAQGDLRLAGTLTYSNASGALLAMLLVVAVSAPRTRGRDAQLVIIAGGLLATQSRGAYLGALVGLIVLARGRRIDAVLGPLLLGLVVGVTAVAGSSGPQHVMAFVIITTLSTAAAVLCVQAKLAVRPIRFLVFAVVLVALTMGLSGTGLWHAVRARVGTASISDRSLEWNAGWRVFVASPLFGGGPGNRFRLSDGRSARFVHNEVIEIAADAGVVGLSLFVIAASAGTLRRRGQPIIDGSAGVLSTLGICGAVDFVWHLPAIAMVAGLLTTGLPARAGCAVRPNPRHSRAGILPEIVSSDAMRT